MNTIHATLYTAGKLLAALALTLVVSLMLSSCHDIPENDDDPYGNFDALWAIIDQHYCFFQYKHIDWDEIGARYRAEINPAWEQKQLFEHCAKMLAELEDGHTNLISWFQVSYYKKWWSDYPQNFDLRLVQEHYLDFDYKSGSGFIYKVLEDRNVGYCYFGSFSASVSNSFISNMLLEMKDMDGIIIDVRDNGGGDISNVEKIASHFIDQTILAGYIQHKTGPGHNDFSQLYPFNYEPVEHGVRWLKPVVVLTNRSTFSAANNFVSVMKQLPQVCVIGDITGGGSGMPFSSELPCGWGVRFSASPVYDSKMQATEYGIPPHIKVAMQPAEAALGIDNILEAAIGFLNKQAAKHQHDNGQKEI